MTKPPPIPTNVFPLGLSKKPRRKPSDKWTPKVMAQGFCTVPSMLLQAQARIPLSAEELAIVMQLADFWWDASSAPHPAKDTLATRTGMGPRQIQRHLAALEKRGLVKRQPRHRGPKQQVANGYSLEGLVKKLAELEPAFRKEREQKRIRKKKLESA